MDASIKKRIADARKCIAYADRCEKEASAMALSPYMAAVIKADIANVRDLGERLLRELISEQEKTN